MIKTLQYIAEHYGNDVLRDGNKLLAYYTDLAPQQKTERKMLEFLVKCNGNTKLLDIAHQTPQEQQVCVEMLVKQLTSQLLISEDAAYTACNNYLQAIGGKSTQESTYETPLAPTTGPTTSSSQNNERSYCTEKQDQRAGKNRQSGGKGIIFLAILLALAVIVVIAFSTGNKGKLPSTIGDDLPDVAPVDINEPNNSIESATDAQVGNTYVGVLSSVNDKDYFRIPANGHTILNYTFTRNASHSVDGIGWEITNNYGTGTHSRMAWTYEKELTDSLYQADISNGYFIVWIENTRNDSDTAEVMEFVSHTEYLITFSYGD